MQICTNFSIQLFLQLTLFVSARCRGHFECNLLSNISRNRGRTGKNGHPMERFGKFIHPIITWRFILQRLQSVILLFLLIEIHVL